MHQANSDDYVDLYQCSDASLADRAVRLLHREGIQAVARAVASDMFPTSVGLDNAHVVSVDTNHAEAARRCLKSAADDGVIPGDAIF